MRRTKKSSFLLGAIFLALFSIVIFSTASEATATGPTVKWVDATDGSDANNGNTEATAYKTLQTAIDASHPGTSDTNRSVINVKDGVYGGSGQTSCEGFPAAVAINNLDYLTIQAAPGANPVVKPDTAVESDIVSISIDDSDHLIIDNIDSDQTIAQFDNWHVCNSDDLTVRNARFEGGEDGIDFGTGFTGALIENNQFINIDTGNGDEVLDFTDGAYADVTIQDNLFENNYRQITIFPPTVGQATNFIIRRNVMNGTTSQEAVRLIGPDGVTLENNVIMNSTQQGLYIDNGTSNVNVWHNSFFNNGEEEIRTKVDSADIVIKNNIIYANGNSAAISADTSPLPSEDFNLLFNNGTDTESSQPAVTSFGANTITGQDPLFVSTTPGNEDLSLQSGSPAIEAGTDLGVTDDIEKNARPNPAGTNPDIGAYEVHFDEEGPITTDVSAAPNPVALNTSVLLTANVDDTTTGGSDIASADYSVDGGTTWVNGGMSASDGSFDGVIEDVETTIGPFSDPVLLDVCVRGTDAAGNTGAEECIILAVYDPDAGFVTGGGWIDSPAGATMPVQGLEVVTPEDVDDSWFFVEEIPNGSHTFVSGPGTPPYGSGSLELSVDGTGRAIFGTAQFSNLRLDEIEALAYSTYQPSSNTGFDELAITLQLDVDYDVTDTDTSWQGRLVFEPYHDNTVVEETWQTWDVMNTASWWASGSPGNTQCPQSAPCTWSEVLSAFPDAGIRETATTPGFLWFKAGGPWSEGFDGNVDGLVIDVAGNAQKVFDFELADNRPTGKANFGFVSKYKKGANVPTGNTQFVFKNADLNFHSSAYEWLVVTGSNNAKFKGTGTINGQPSPTGEDFKFQIWAGDDDPDTFRIKIWYEDNGTEVVVYDNGMDQPIGGGSIKIHAK